MVVLAGMGEQAATEETERVAVKTYVPRYQKEIWADHADELDMSQSEFVRTMVQAGRTGFSGDTGKDGDASDGETADPPSPTDAPNDLHEAILAIVEREGPVGKDELIGAFEETIVDVLEELNEDGKIQWDVQANGYVAPTD